MTLFNAHSVIFFKTIAIFISKPYHVVKILKKYNEKIMKQLWVQWVEQLKKLINKMN